MDKSVPGAKADSLNVAAFDFSELFAMSWHSAEATARVNSQVCENATRVQASLLDFAGLRLTANFEVAKSLAGRGRLEDAVEDVFQFQRQAVLDYAEQARRIVKMCTAMTGDLIQEIEDEVSESAAEASGIAKVGTSRAADLLIREIENVLVGDSAEESDAKVSPAAVEDDQINGSGRSNGEDTAEAPEPASTETSARSQPPSETSEEAAAGPTISLKVASGEKSDPELQRAILNVLAETDKPMTLAEIAWQVGPVHYATLIRPMRSLCTMARVAKHDKTYRLA